MRTLQGLSLLTLGMLLLGCSPGTPEPSADVRDPVITRVANPKLPYPAAAVAGRLSMKDGCLMLGDGVVFWPAGTTWDEANRQVVFGGDFEGSPAAPVDSRFTGGGGVFDVDGDMSGVLRPSAENALRQCLDKTGATHALLAYPEWP